jgi:3',5'-cyclic-AMP phosphodiesterase
MNILQFTDPHLYGRSDGKLRGVQTDSTLRTVMQAAFAQCPDYEAVLVSGDLVQEDPAGYIRFRNLFAPLQKPVLCVPGNHDVPEAMREELRGAPFQICGTWQAKGWQIVMLDSYEEGEVGGRLSEAELARLDAALHASPLHALICLHHHPVLMRSRWLDGIGLANFEDFWRVVDAHPHVRAVVWGHVHQEFEGSRGAVRLFATPSTGAQFLPLSDDFAIDTRPPAYRQFRLGRDGSIHSQVQWVTEPAVRLAAS